MERLWSPWRLEYITNTSPGQPQNACIFCEAQKNPAHDAQSLIVHRGLHNFVILNKYPYTSGHLMIAPNSHLGHLSAAPKEVTDEMMDLLKRSQKALIDAYNPEGFNVGMNLGKVAGAGVADHLHMHILPRWGGDTNFMSTVGETRVLPEDLSVTYQKLSGKI
ncbi:MAG TPA: HIT domain-containing protein [Pyrinomonadaceae bacterium]|nr:HIT domain-containing protein [Pyrinomonadaceae bacterium]